MHIARGHNIFRESSIRAIGVAAVLSVGGLIAVVGCEDLRSCGSGLLVRGILLDDETGTAITDAAIAGQVFTQGERTDYRAGRLPSSSSVAPPLPSEDGSFELVFNTGSQYPCPLLGPRPFPRPDQVEVILIREACIQRFMIDVNEDTIVDLTFPEDIIEIKDPILVPPCVE